MASEILRNYIAPVFSSIFGHTDSWIPLSVFCFFPQDVTTDEGKSSGCLTFVHRDAAALTLIMTCSVRRLHVGSWRPVNNKRGPSTASRLAPAPVWFSETLITTPLMDSSITSREPARTCWLGHAGRWLDYRSLVWRPKMRTVEWLLFPGSKMSQWRCMVIEFYYQKEHLGQSR